MFLSKIMIADNEAYDIYKIHQAIWSLFPDDPEAERDFLFRAERRGAFGPCPVLLQSLRTPRGNSGARVLATKEFVTEMPRGAHLRFLIVANPVKTLSRDEKGRSGVRVPLIQEEQQHAWLRRKLGDAAELIQLEVDKMTPFLFTKRERKNKRVGKIQPVRYTGILRVLDPQNFNGLLCQGIGPGKGLGCGMISIAPA